MNYSLQIYFDNTWRVVARFDAEVYDGAIAMADCIAVDPMIRAENIAIVDDMTGEVVWSLDTDENPFEEPADIDDDCGFDPYEGCFTYDC